MGGPKVGEAGREWEASKGWEDDEDQEAKKKWEGDRGILREGSKCRLFPTARLPCCGKECLSSTLKPGDINRGKKEKTQMM